MPGYFPKPINVFLLLRGLLKLFCIAFSAHQVAVLKLFLLNRGIVFSREQILGSVDGMNWSSGDRSIDVIISRLRTKLNDNPREPKYFESVRGIGYRMMQNE